MRLDTYRAWAETKPAVVQPTIQVAQQAVPGYGGAAIGLRYIPQGTDPSGAGVHWFQIIGTNAPLANPNGIYTDPASGTAWYIDDAPNNLATEGPFYDAHGAATTDDFIDRPTRQYADNTDWQAAVFIATGNPAAKTLNISNQGVFWGFHDPLTVANPEPSTLVLAFSGSLILILWRARLRSRWASRIEQMT
jgi:hypothetical protein